MKRVRRGEFDPSFSNASLEEMAARVEAQGRQTDQRNRRLLWGFFLALGLLIAIGVNVYDHWLTATFQALGTLFTAIWHWQWWHAAAIFLEYKLSFFLLGLIAGVIIAFIVAFQIIETLFDLIWDTFTSFFN
ncbi:MAG: hypothetical protein KF832_11610 [Caldilineaceae bacterium]|nr:hypothetical protein [Caldilineaceae bacterium]